MPTHPNPSLSIKEIRNALDEELAPLAEQAREEGWGMTWSIHPAEVDHRGDENENEKSK